MSDFVATPDESIRMSFGVQIIAATCREHILEVALSATKNAFRKANLERELASTRNAIKAFCSQHQFQKLES